MKAYEDDLRGFRNRQGKYGIGYSIELIYSEYPISQEYLEKYLEERSRPYTLEVGGILGMKYREDSSKYWEKEAILRRVGVKKI
ncbi:hypothetical protein Trydic_g13781 [Trypoxylus dichotomus]